MLISVAGRKLNVSIIFENYRETLDKLEYKSYVNVNSIKKSRF